MQITTPTTWEDVLRMPDDGNRYEFIGGRLYMTPAPVIRHHDVSHRLESALRRTLERTGHGRVFDAPVLVEFPGTGDRVQPDIFFVSNARRGIVGEKQMTGAPDLVVEILSPLHSTPRPRRQARSVRTMRCTRILDRGPD